jgi:hypothetical protein
VSINNHLLVDLDVVFTSHHVLAHVKYNGALLPQSIDISVLATIQHVHGRVVQVYYISQFESSDTESCGL